MSSFQRRRKVYELDFEGTEYDGLVVKVRGLTTGEYLDFLTLSSTDGSETDEMLRLFAEHLASWNLIDEEDKPVPATYEGLRSNDLGMNNTMISAWTAALAGVPEELGKKSSDGDPALVASIPTEAL